VARPIQDVLAAVSTPSQVVDTLIIEPEYRKCGKNFSPAAQPGAGGNIRRLSPASQSCYTNVC